MIAERATGRALEFLLALKMIQPSTQDWWLRVEIDNFVDSDAVCGRGRVLLDLCAESKRLPGCC